jgi:hypothetical protein
MAANANRFIIFFRSFIDEGNELIQRTVTKTMTHNVCGGKATPHTTLSIN